MNHLVFKPEVLNSKVFLDKLEEYFNKQNKDDKQAIIIISIARLI